MDIEKLNEVVRKRQNLADTYRGKVLAAAIHVEEWMSTVIVTHFTRKYSKAERLKARGRTHSVLIQSMKWAFDDKAEIIRRIILTEEYLEKSDRSKLITDIQRVAKTRNELAHWRLDEYSPSTYDFDGNTLQFSTLSFANDKLEPKTRIVTTNSINAEIMHSIGVVEKLRKLDRIVWG